MSAVFGHPVAQALAWALIHFVWQGAAIALILIAIQRSAPLSASARYLSGVVALGVMLIAPIATFLRLSATIPASVPPAATDTSAFQFSDAASRLGFANTQLASSTATDVLPIVILAIWAIGVTVLSLRLLGGWIVARRLARRALSPVSAEIQALARRVAGRLALDRVVGVFESSAVTVPVMIGWMKPVVLLPASAISGLSIVQVEALLAHELAHVRRHDYVVNLLQSAVETLLFYHPAVWFVSRRMRIDREHCCDDLAVHVCDRVIYASALSDLAAMTATPRMALAATDGSLLHRVRRILGQPAGRQDAGTGWMSACLVVLLAGSLAPVVMTKNASDAPPSQVEDVVLPQSQPRPVVTAGQAGAQVTVEKPIEVTPEQSPTEQARVEERRVLENQIRDLQKQLERLQRESGDTDKLRAEARAKLSVADLEARLQNLVIDRERMRKMVEQDLIGKSQIEELDAKIAAIQRQMSETRGDKELYAKDLDLLKQKIAEQKMSEAELEALLTRKDEAVAKVQLDEVQQVERAKEVLARQRAAAIEAAATTLGENEQARAGDLAIIEIQSERDLPRTYTVQSDGTIKFPLLGSIPVQGLTARQIAESLSKQFKDRKLTASGVQVSLRRSSER